MKYFEKVNKEKERIRNAGYESIKHYNFLNTEVVGTLYIKEKMDYGFHIYHIHEPSETDKLAGTNGTLTEMYYDLRNQVYWIKRNLKEVKFSVRNIDTMFPRSSQERSNVFSKLSTPNNRGLYIDAFRYLGSMGEEKRSMYGRFFHRLITEHSYFELLHKAGIDIASKRMRVFNANGKSPKDILGLSKTKWKMYSKYGVDIDELQSLDDNQKSDKEAINYLAYLKRLENEFGIEKIKSFVSKEFDYIYTKEDQGYRTRRSVLRIADTYNIPAKILIKYIYFECDVSQGLSSMNAINEYEDYIRMATEMGYERFDRYPKFLRTVHDIVSRNYNIQLNEKEMEEWNKAYEVNKNYEFEDKEYKIIAPVKPEDLVKEGNVLGHCVGSYVNKVRKGLSVILFLREKDDLEKPLVTVEVIDGKVTEARGKMNNLPSQNEYAFIKKFKKSLKQESIAV